MKRGALLSLLFLTLCTLASAQNLGSFNGHCQKGGQNVVTQGLVSSGTQPIGSTTPVLGVGVAGSYPQCTVSVFYTGTTNLVPSTSIYANNLSSPTVLGNPFTANTDDSFLFFAATQVGYDIQTCGGGLPACQTPYVQEYLCNVNCGSSGGGGGGGISGSGTALTFPIWTGTSSIGNSKLVDNNATLAYNSGMSYTNANSDVINLNESGLSWSGNYGITIKSSYTPAPSNDGQAVGVKGSDVTGSACAGEALLQGGQSNGAGNYGAVIAAGGCSNGFGAVGADVDITAGSTSADNSGGNVVITAGTGGFANGQIKLQSPVVGDNISILSSLTTTSATSDNVTLTGMTSSGHCSLTATNSSAATNIATTYVSAKTTNQITVTHTATASMTYDVMCTPN